MGMLIDGVWSDQNVRAKSKDGGYQRAVTSFRNWITVDGAPGPSGDGGFKAERDRYHLYVSLACPWAHRALIFRKLKDLEEIVPISIVNSFMGDEGWTFLPGEDVIADPILNATHLHQIYTEADPDITARVSVPVLFDKKQNTIVSNESAEIIRMFNSTFDQLTGNSLNFRPSDRLAEIDALNDRIYATVNNGVYRCGFATSQEAYDIAVSELFETLDAMEEILSRQRYLTGSDITEADLRIFPTLVRFDPVYHGHFKCNIRRIVDYPNLWEYVRDIYQQPGIAETVNFNNIKNHYYQSHESINPTRIVPKGPDLDFNAPHGRDRAWTLAPEML